MNKQSKSDHMNFPISCDQEFFRKLESFCEMNSLNRSKFIRLAVLKEIEFRNSRIKSNLDIENENEEIDN